MQLTSHELRPALNEGKNLSAYSKDWLAEIWYLF